MSDHVISTPKAEIFDPKPFAGLTLALGVIGILGLLASLLGAYVAREQFAFSWLFAFSYFFTLCVGSLFWILVHHATDAEWSVVVRRQLENVATLMPMIALFFIPILFCAPILFKWWDLAPGMDVLRDAKSPYLNIPFFLIRSFLYFLLLSGVAILLRRYSIKQDTDGNPLHTLSMRKVAIFGIPCFAFSLTFGAFDWLMGLDYKWFSTMWGVYIFAGAAGSSMSMLVLITTALRKKGYFKNIITVEHYHIMGKLMLAFTVFWAYIGFSQYMLIWYANIPEETSYFLRRNTETWNYMSIFLVVGRFFIPFPVLLMQATKKNPRMLCFVATWILFMQMVDLYIIVMPMLYPAGVHLHLLDLVALISIGSTLGFLFIRSLNKSSLFPVRDPRLPESLNLTN